MNPTTAERAAYNEAHAAANHEYAAAVVAADDAAYIAKRVARRIAVAAINAAKDAYKERTGEEA